MTAIAFISFFWKEATRFRFNFGSLREAVRTVWLIKYKLQQPAGGSVGSPLELRSGYFVIAEGESVWFS